MDTKMNKYLFGPVQSRRYGRSLGVDLSIPKTCDFSCRFCQLGPTPRTTVERVDNPPIREVLDELERWAREGGVADFITEAGSGEPTLHPHFGEVFRWARERTGTRTLLLSNGSLFFLPEVRREAAGADVVKVSLHAWDQASFMEVTQAHESLRLSTIIEGYRRFREEYTGRLDLEVFILPGINDRPDQAEKIAKLAASFSPDSITLNTAVRPPADSSVKACPPEVIETLLPLFGPHAHAGGKEPPIVVQPLSEEALVGLVDRHPVSLGVLAHTFSKPEKEMRALLERLAAGKRIQLFSREGELFAGPSGESFR